MPKFKTVLIIIGVLVALVAAPEQRAWAQATNTPTVTPTSTPTSTATLTPTINVTLVKRGKAFNQETQRLLEGFSPASKKLGLYDLLGLNVRQVRRAATNATALGLTDVVTVTSIMAFNATTQAAHTKLLLYENVDFSVVARDVVPIGDHSGEIWVITYRP